MKWTPRQQRTYRALCADLARVAALSEENRRDIIARLCDGRRSTSDIDRPQMAALIREMERLCAQAGCERRKARAPRSRINQDQYIAILQDTLQWNEARLAGFIRRQTHGWKSSVLDLTRHEKTVVINGLKAEISSQKRGKASVDRPEKAVCPPPFRAILGGRAPQKK